ncbi:MAG: CapA family protein [Firmicutes bacterium]|nr:CapA family protein [[Eubacterium] siraeum]MCM1487531.1 CapA family protein [Bacillota bacterium]
MDRKKIKSLFTYQGAVRSCYWDNIKGLLILLVVFAHFVYQLQTYTAINNLVDMIYTFHMPAFAFVSGFFGKSEKSRSFEAIIRLIFLYFIFNSITGFIYGFGSVTEPLYSYWYLLALTAWRLTAHRIAQFPYIQAVLFAAAIFAGFFEGIDNSFAIARTIAFYPYYMAGYLLTEEKNRELLNRPLPKRLAAGVGALAAGGGLAWIFIGLFRYSDDALLMSGYVGGLDVYGRLGLFIVGFLMIFALRNIVPDKKLPFLTTVGRNSLWIFIFHRPVTLEAERLLRGKPVWLVILLSAAMTVICCAVLGSEPVGKAMNRLAQAGAEIFTQREKKSAEKRAVKLLAAAVALGFAVSAVSKEYAKLYPASSEITPEENVTEDEFYRIITPRQQADFDSAFKITFAGDLLLLEDQVKSAYREDTDSYDFTDVFEYARDYIASADLAIGVFEGPMAGKEAGYTTGNFDDGKMLYLNFPDEFASAVKNAGFDLVTTANNHLLDRWLEGEARTLDVLDSIGLDHTGSYRSPEEKEKERIKTVEKDGIKIAVLSYTYGSNYTDTEFLAKGAFSYLTSVISGTEGELFEALKEEVERDFDEAKALDPDLIIVLPHIGTQFSNRSDAEQEVWFKIFKDCGADIILGDHAHAVQPVYIEEYGGKNVFTAYCPGNFANLYRENQGDASALVEVYISPDTKEIIGGGIVPLYTQSPLEGNYRALPIYETEYNEALRKQLSTDDYQRAKEAHLVVTSVMLGCSPDISAVTKSYLFDSEGFLRQKASGLQLTEEMKSGILCSRLAAADSVCFIGDSVTEGTKNGGCPWYEPLEEHFSEKDFYNFSKGGCTIGYIIDNEAQIPAADLYVIAVGTNDVRYRDASVCAMTSEDFVKCAEELKDILLSKSPSAELIFIAPWYSSDGDTVCSMTYEQKTALNQEYSEALEAFCSGSSLYYINANPYIQSKLSRFSQSVYLSDHIHPKQGKGVVMYCEGVCLS